MRLFSHPKTRQFYVSMIAISHLSSGIVSPTLGGTIETEIRKPFGQETTQASTVVSAVSIRAVLMFRPRAIVILAHLFY